MLISADTKIAHVVAALRSGYMDEVAREHLAGLLEEARTMIRENAPMVLNQDSRKALIGS